MRVAFIIAGIVLAAGVLFYLVSCGNKSASGKPATTGPDTQPNLRQQKENPFEGLRNIAFTATPERLGLSLPADKTIVFGVIIDWEISDATATIVSYQTGDASLYLSSGGGIIGGGHHENVNTAAKKFVSLGQAFLDKATKDPPIFLPETDQVKFYLLTNKGIYGGQDTIDHLEKNNSAWQALFDEGNKVLTELRMIADKK